MKSVTATMVRILKFHHPQIPSYPFMINPRPDGTVLYLIQRLTLFNFPLDI